jgi:hypothetical protein
MTTQEEVIEVDSVDRDAVLFCFSYEHLGRRWVLQIHCFDWEDAEARAKLLNLTLDGKLVTDNA